MLLGSSVAACCAEHLVTAGDDSSQVHFGGEAWGHLNRGAQLTLDEAAKRVTCLA